MKVTKQMQTKADHFTSADPENFNYATHPLKIFMKFDLLVELLFLIPTIPIFSELAKWNQSCECLKTATFCVH